MPLNTRKTLGKQNPLSLQQALDLAVRHHQAGHLEDAEVIYNQILKTAPDQPVALNLKGCIELQKGNNTSALKLLEKATKASPGYADAFNNLGIAYKGLGQLEKAAAHYERAISLKPNYTDAYNNLGVAMALLGRSKQSVSAYQNAFRCRTGFRADGDERLAPATDTFFIEVTNKCNFHCTFCPSDSQTRTIGFMDLNLIKRCYDEITSKKIANEVCLHLMGEPTLHPDLEDILKHGAKCKIKTSVVTNGSTLVPKTVPKILDSLYGSLEISHMTPTEETYPFRGKVGLSWERYIGNIRYLIREYVERLAKGQAWLCDVVIRVMVSKGTAANVSILNTDEEAQDVLQEWIGFVEELEDEFDLPPFKRDKTRIADMKLVGGQKFKKYNLQTGLCIQFWEAFTFANTQVSDEYTLSPSPDAAFCHNPFKDFAVLWNGDVTLCCLDYDGQLTVGNINEDTAQNIMFGQKAQDLRASMLGQGSLPPYCKTCQKRPVPNNN